MQARTVVSIDELTGTQTSAARQFFSGHASPEFLIPHLADFYTWTVEARVPLTVASYLRYTSDHPGALPDDEPAGRRLTDAQRSGGLDYLYRLTLSEDQHGLRLRIHDLSTQQVPGGTGEPIETLTQAGLYAAAARCCETVAARCERYAASNDGVPMPGGEPDTWRQRAARYRQHGQATAVAALAANPLSVKQVHPATFDTPHPALQVAGVLVFAYVDRHGRLRVSVHLDETEPWLFAGGGTVPTRITVEDTDVFTA
jgi:hypothetical protein